MSAVSNLPVRLIKLDNPVQLQKQFLAIKNLKNTDKEKYIFNQSRNEKYHYSCYKTTVTNIQNSFEHITVQLQENYTCKICEMVNPATFTVRTAFIL